MFKKLFILIILPTLALAQFGSFTQKDIDRIGVNTELQITMEDTVRFSSGTADTVPFLDINKDLTSSTVTSTELGYLSGVTSSIQTQLDSKLESPVDLTSEVTGILPLANGGTGSATQNFVDLTTAQSIAGVKTFTGELKTSSTTAPSVPAPVMTEAQRDLLAGPTKGDQVFNSDSNTLNVYDGTDWVEVGSGGGAGLDVFVAEDFEKTVAADFSTGNNAAFLGGGSLAGTLTDETVSPIAGESSLKYTQAAGSLNDYFASPVIDIDIKQAGNLIGASLYFTYDGDEGDISVIAYDATNSEVLTGALDVVGSESNPTRFSTSFTIPAGVTQIRYGFQVEVLNSGKVLVVDDIQLSTGPDSFLVDVNETETYQVNRSSDFWDATGTTDDFDISLGSNADNPLFIVEDSGGRTRIRAKRDIEVTVGFLAAASAGGGVNLRDSSSNIINLNQINAATDAASVTSRIKLAAGDFVYGEANSANRQGGVVVTATATTEHIVTPVKSNAFDNTDFTPTGSWTNTTYSGVYSRVGQYMHVTVKGVLTGTPAAADLTVDIPSGFTIDTAAVPSHAQGGVASGVAELMDVGTKNWTGTIAIFDSNTVSVLADANGGEVSLSNPFTWGNTDEFSISFRVPIVGWTSDVAFLAAIPVARVMYIRDVKSSNTAAGASFTSYTQRDLNTLSGDIFGTLSSNQFTLPPGKYVVRASAPAHKSSDNRIRLRNVTDSTFEYGQVTRADDTSTGGGTSNATLKTVFEITSSKTYEIQHFCEIAKASDGFGRAVNDGQSEIYTEVEVTKLR